MNQDQAIDNLNYASDPRTQGEAKAPELCYWGCANCGEPEDQCACDRRGGSYEEVDITIKLPSKWAVCPVCDGEGKHVNPAIDAGGITIYDDRGDYEPDFAEQYWNGTYDQTCTRCNGKRVVPVVDLDVMPSWMQREYERDQREEAEYRAERLAEIRAGC